MRAEKKCQALPQVPSAGTCLWLSGTVKLLSQYSPGSVLDSRATQRRVDYEAERALEAAPGSSGPAADFRCQEAGGLAWHEDL